MLKCILVESKRIKDYCTVTLETEEVLSINPGQFVMLKNRTEPVLAKPFSVVSQEGNRIKLLIRIIGRFTKYISEAEIGEVFYVRGPNGIEYREKICCDRKYILIGGGCGSAPLMHFESTFPNLVEKAFYGFKDKEILKLLPEDGVVIEEVCGKTSVEAAYHHFHTLKEQNTGIISCGTIPMHKAVISTFKAHENVKVFVSLDERMGCGIGMCKGCPIKTVDGIKMICKDGPIFDSDEIYLNWDI